MSKYKNKLIKKKKLSRKMSKITKSIITGAKNLKELSMEQMKATLRI